MRDNQKWIIAMILQFIIFAVTIGIAWGTVTADVNNLIKQTDKMEKKIDKIYDILLE
ncbi:MAG: hypothetical protein V3V14_12275 [Saprospiraceae bacterium]